MKNPLILLVLALMASCEPKSEDQTHGIAVEFRAMLSQMRDGLSHRDVLRSHQTTVRLFECGQDYRESQHCMSAYSEALDAALEEWGSSQNPEDVESEEAISIAGELHTVRLRRKANVTAEADKFCSTLQDRWHSSVHDSCEAELQQEINAALQRMDETREAAAPPRQIPEELWHDFTDSGATPVLDWYRDDSYAAYYKQYPRPFLQVMEAMVAERRPGTNYPFVDRDLYALLDTPDSEVRAKLQGAVVGVMGSAVPWYEVLALHYGAVRAVTIEYNRVSYQDHRIDAMTPEEYWGMGEQRPRFDIALSISSFEHDGLGRYGDPLNPFGDFEAMAEMENVLRPGGTMLLAVPVAAEAVVWNCHRIYGRRRLTELLHRWTIRSVHGLYGGIFGRRTFVPDQPLFVLENRRPDSPADFTREDEWP